MSAEEERPGFLARWSRRKREAAEAPPEVLPEVPPAEALPELPAEGVTPPPATEATPAPRRAACPIPDVPEVDPATLPPIEELTPESDFSVFLKPGVPTLLRNAALRRMWSLDPAIRDYIGPVDYQWDFNAPGGLPFGFASELGGDVTKLLAQAIGKIEELAEEEPPPEAGPDAAGPALAGPDGESPPTLPEEAAPEPLLAHPAEPDALPVQAATPAEPPPASRRRHGGALPG